MSTRLFIPALIAVVLSLSACSNSGAETASAAAVAPAATRSIVDAAGQTVRVPTRAQRVIVLSEIDLDAALALGVKPVGATNGRGQGGVPSYLAGAAAGVASVGSFGQPSLDRILALQPDLILAGGNADPQLLAQLAQIAPTVVSFKVGESWRDSFARMAEVLGRGDAARTFFAEYDAAAKQLAVDLQGKAGATVSIVRWTAQGPVYMLGDAFAGRVLADVGFARPKPQQAPGAGHSSPLSREALSQIDADWLFLGAFKTGTKADPAGFARLLQEPEFKELAAARAGHVREVDAALWTSVGGPLAARQLLADVRAAMLGQPS
ncbi:MAG TPA: iron-siderophore ABC transporter substrate-binding protein [Chitinolyticbacter sp.]|nr:iron-siderophore ABC transporter substrate-binding protein [Chitinolyticbacter sp.]